MSIRYVYLVVFLIFYVVQFSNCENTESCDENEENNLDSTQLSLFELKLKLRYPLNIIKSIGNSIRFPRLTDIFKKKENSLNIFTEIRAIYPGRSDIDQMIDFQYNDYTGTKWCGDGNISSDGESLGIFANTDKCCKEHDNCQSNIQAGEEKYNLTNTGMFTRSACYCDTAFYNCLKKSKNLIATKIGVTYFDILKPQCFQCVCPVDCRNNNEECTDTDQCTKYKWVSNLPYI